MIILGKLSRARLEGVHPDLRRVVACTANLAEPDEDFTVLEGVRTPARQKELYAQGRTKPGPKVTWTLKSNHFVNPKTGFGHAVDLAPWPIDWNDLKRFAKLTALIKRAAAIEEVAISCGADWKRKDHPHVELAS